MPRFENYVSPGRTQFLCFYKKQGILRDVEDWQEFLLALDKPLPITFRVSPISLEFKRQVDWYADRTCWEFNYSKAQLKMSSKDSEDASHFQSFLLNETAIGSISRQELVSMIPPMLLSIQQHHKVLDMCASPGSKTTQLLEQLQRFGATTKRLSDGFVVANDANRKRACLLAFQCNRLGSPSLLVTCHQAQWFPSNITYDRILCDVPCSGDGTIRKAGNLLKTWSTIKGLSLHATQVSLALRAATLLKVDGLMVYSTCTFNPLENEAVVAELLVKTEGKLSLIDIHNEIPGLVKRQGLSSWHVPWQKKNNADSKMYWFNKWEQVPDYLLSRLKRSMFPPCDQTIAPELKKCLRLLPHDNNTGGFFIALLRKTAEFKLQLLKSPLSVPPWKDYQCSRCGGSDHYIKHCRSVLPSETDDSISCPSCNHQFSHPKALFNHVSNNSLCEEQLRVEPKLMQSTSYPIIQPILMQQFEEIKCFYGIDDKFSKLQLLTRSKYAANVYFVSKGLASYLISLGKENSLNVVQAGVRIFVRDNLKTPYHRIAQESLSYILPFVTKRIVRLDVEDLIKILDMKVKQVSWTELSPRGKDILTNSTQGPVVLTFQSSSVRFDSMFPFMAWIGVSGIHKLVSKEYSFILKETIQEFKQLKKFN